MAGGRDVGLLSSLAEQSSAGQTKSLISSSLAKHSFARQPNTKYSASLANVKHSRDRRSFTPPCLAKTKFSQANRAQFILISGVVVSIALAMVTIMLNNIVYVGNTAALESMDTSQSEISQMQRLTFQEIHHILVTQNDSVNFSKYMANYSRGMSLSSAQWVLAVNASIAESDNGIVKESDIVWYCGNYSTTGNASNYGIWSWMNQRQPNRDYKNYSSDCDGLIGALNSSVPPNVTIFEDPGINLNESQRSKLYEWFKLGGTLIQTGNGSLVNDTMVGCTMYKSTNPPGNVKSPGNFLKNVDVGDYIDFAPVLAYNWSYGCEGVNYYLQPSVTEDASSIKNGTFYYFPGMKGDVSASDGTVLFKDNLRCVLNLFGQRDLVVTISDGVYTYNATMCGD